MVFGRGQDRVTLRRPTSGFLSILYFYGYLGYLATGSITIIIINSFPGNHAPASGSHTGYRWLPARAAAGRKGRFCRRLLPPT